MDFKIIKKEMDKNLEIAKTNGYTELTEVACKECNGTGIVADVRIEPRCCGNFNEFGGCCNYPVPDYIQEPKQCEKCQATGIESV